MYTVLLAEDEPLVRMGIKSMVDWEKLDMRVCAECSDGAEALQTCRRLKPDLIITDLKMPVMDGMSLIRAVRAEDARTRILVLTCLEDFDAARQAIEFDVSGYVMKLSCTVEKLTDILRRVRGELDSLSARERRPEEVDLQPIRESMFFDYVRYRSLDCAHFLKGMQSMGMAVWQGRLSLTVMRLMEYERFLEKDPGGRTLRTMVLELVRLALRDSDRWECYCDHPGEYVLLFACGDADAAPRDEGLLRVSDLLDDHLNVDSRFSPENVGEGYEDLPHLYDRARRWLDDLPTRDCPRKIAGALSIIRRNYAKPISLQSVADELSVSTGYLSRLFLSTVGCTFTDMLNQTRVDRAKQLLNGGEIPVYRVGELVGIANATYFIRVFRKYTGVTPNEYRGKPV